MTYSILQWVMFFYLYCFVGWIWETLYVSVKKTHWVNRGFMHGPFLPIYGAGFTGMILLTNGIRGNYVAEYIVGLIGATIMEYYTGMCMEKLFKVRYWDYTDRKINLNGYICLQASLLWGVFAILGPEFVHPFVEGFVLKIPRTALEIIVLVLTAGISADFCGSFKEALDLKEVLVSLTEKNEEFAKIEKGVQSIQEFVNGDLKVTSEAGLKKINETFTEGRNAYIKKTEQIAEVKEKLMDSLEKAKQLPESINMQNIKMEIEENIRNINLLEKTRSTIKAKRSVKGSYRIIKRNPGVISKEFQQALLELKNDLNKDK